MNNLLNKHLDLNKADFILTNPNLQAREIELWNSFRSGNHEAFTAIFEKYVRHLYSYGRSMTHDEGLISDCIQDIFVELWMRRETLTVQVKSIKYYLIKSVRRRISQRLSDNRQFVGQSIPEDYIEEIEFHIEFQLIQEQISSELSLQLKASLATLSKAQQEAMYLKFYENMRYEEIASVMKTNVKAVYNLVGKSIISLRKFFKAHSVEKE